MKQKHILLINLGSPKSLDIKDVRSYLKEFLSDDFEDIMNIEREKGIAEADAQSELFDRFERMLKSSEREVCVFKAPTGSGKTIVVADLLKKLVNI